MGSIGLGFIYLLFFSSLDKLKSLELKRTEKFMIKGGMSMKIQLLTL
jgi:hypothetical protein